MKYTSTGRKSIKASLEDAIFVGLAPDGGLYVPESIPVFTQKEISELPGKSLHEVASITLHKWFHDTFSKQEMDEIVEKSLSFPLPLVEVGGYKVLELFHGPTFAFSDISSRFMTQIFKKILKKKNRKYRMLIASSGDSGGSIAHSFNEDDDTETIVVFPKGKLSAVQQAQITRIGDKVLAIEVNGNFDDCQKLVSKAFTDGVFTEHNLLSASSMSIVRLIPQIIVYVYLYSLLAKNDLSVVIPSGNFGNATTALLAKLMGIPFKKIVIACNKNDAAVRYAKTGKYLPAGNAFDTMSNAMDIADPHNFPRILHLCGYNHKKFLEFFSAFTISDNKVVHTTHAIWSEHEYLLDPHTAVAWAAADELDEDPKSVVIVATAAPVKFAEAIEKHTGIKVENEEILAELHKRAAKYISINNSYEEFKEILLQEFGKNK